MTNRSPTCVSWLLVASYAVLLGIGGLGLWVTAINFGLDEPLPPTQPSTTTTTTTTTTENPYGYRNYHDSKQTGQDSQAYKDYVSKTRSFANFLRSGSLYVALPSLVCGMVAAMVLVAGLCSRRLFGSTFCLYSSLSLMVLTLTLTIVYQETVASYSDFNLDNAFWVLGISISLLLLLAIQILLCMWELRRQEVGWPTINIGNLFTLEAVLLAARLTLCVYTLLSISYSPILQGLAEDYDNYYWNRPLVRYPPVLAIVCFGAATYNAVATMESTLSMLLGKLHSCMTLITSLLSTLCSITLAVLSSPVYVKIVIGPYNIPTETLNFAIGLSVVTFVHAVTCMCIPTVLRSQPDILTKIKNMVMSQASLDFSVVREHMSRFTSLKTRERTFFLYINLVSVMFCIISMIAMAITADGRMYRIWGHVVVLCANSITLARTLTAAVMQLVYKHTEIVHVKQKLMSMIIESALLFVGIIGLLSVAYNDAKISGSVINGAFLAFQCYIIWQMIVKKPEAQESEETHTLPEAEEVAIQDNDAEPNHSDLMA